MKVLKNREEMFEFYQQLIDEHRATLDVDNARDLIDVYLIEIEKAKTEGRAGELFEGRDHGKHRKFKLVYSIAVYLFVGRMGFKNSILFHRTPD